MSLGACIPDLIAQGKIGKAQGEKAQAAYDRHLMRLQHEMGPEAAAAEASTRALAELDYEAALKKRQTVLQVKAQQRIMADIASLPDGPYAGATKVLAAGSGQNIMNVEAQHRVIVGRAHAKMEAVLRRHRRNLIGEARDKSGLTDLVRERFGENTGNLSAKELAAAFGDTAEMLRDRFNKAGGNIGTRPDWGLPQSHDMLKVRGTPMAEWRGDVLDGIAIDRMIDDATGQPFTAESLAEALESTWASIRSDGWTKADAAGGGGQGAKLANKRADGRFLIFKSADAWLAYQQKYGTGTAFDAMMGHVEGMSRDIAMMETMGPNPAATLKWMQDSVKRQAALDPDPGVGLLDKARGAEHQLQDLYDTVSGRINSPVNSVWARRMGGTRAFLTSAFLGSAALSATSDVGFQAVTRAFNGLPVKGAITGYVKLLNPLAHEDRRIAVRLGLVAEEASHMAAALNRYIDGTHGPEIALRMSDAVLRASGLSVWTQVGKWAFGMETLGHLADQRAKGFDALEPAVRGMMERYGIDAAGWDTIRATDTYKYKGGEWLRPDDVADQALGDAMLRMVLTETDYAVPSATARARATLSFGQQPGTLGGEIIRNGALFKSFGVSMLLTHGARMMGQQGFNRLAYFAGLTGTTTLMGALAVQLREVAQGRDAQDMNPLTNPFFWGKALLQGGGYGIFGDFLQAGANENRFGGGLAETIAGPVVGAAGDLLRSGGKLIGAAIDPDKDMNPGAETIKLLRRYMPGGSLWYVREAYNRMVVDQLQRQIDPNYDLSWGRMEDAADKQGQGYWWRPGELAPERAPVMADRPPD